ncbi:MAG TPA: hypothetical protein DEB52_16925 [Hyphomonas sp.]|jgi:hypothetical protein|nr:hypothetical protein [Hyphomonas sp.]|tara:strand:+ start:14630 stop:16528 length:1899 start_codon:yes stop_codon:yes gene_type:complete
MQGQHSPFVWGQGGRKMTPDQVERQRELVAAAQGRMGDTSPVGNWMQGATRVVDALGGVLRERRTDKAETEGMAGADAYIQNNPVLASLIGGGGVANDAGPAPLPYSTEPTSPVGGGDIRSGLVQRGLPEHIADAFVLNFQDESGLDPGINEVNPLVEGSRGGFGLSQWTGPRRRALETFASQRNKPVSDMDTQLDFLMYELQGPESEAAQKIFAAPDTGTAAAAIVNDFLRPSETYRASREARYLGGGGGGSTPGGYAPQPRQDPGVIAALAQGMSDPWVAKKYGPVIQALMGQQMARQNAAYEQDLRQSDPAYQMGLEKSQLELDAMRNPVADPWAGIEEINGQLVQMTPEGPQSIGDFRTADPGYQPLSPQEAEAMGLPSGSYQKGPDGKVSQVGGGGVTVNNNMGDDKFGEAFAKGDAALLGTISESGIAAQRNLGRIDQLENSLANSPSGAGGLLRQAAGEWGINTEGLSEIQAAQALINSLVPEQRQPGSGPMSDADLELFKQSLPRIINQPGGNQAIIGTMRAIAQYDAQGAEIVQRLRAGEIDRAQAFAELQSRSNPLEGFKSPGAPEAGAGQPGSAGQPQPDATQMTPDQISAMSPAEAAMVDFSTLNEAQKVALERALGIIQ